MPLYNPFKNSEPNMKMKTKLVEHLSIMATLLNKANIRIPYLLFSAFSINGNESIGIFTNYSGYKIPGGGLFAESLMP